MDFDSDGISASWPASSRWQAPHVSKIRWKDIDKVIAYKKDCYVSDQVRLEFLAGQQKSVVITEEMAGWNELILKLSKFIPGFPEFDEWFRKIAARPFETNLTILYDRGHPRQID